MAEKEVFSAGFPLTLSFRNDRLHLKNNFSDWEEAHINYNGITKKYLAEEIDNAKPWQATLETLNGLFRAHFNISHAMRQR